ncbi:3-keto-disaccharide hydrolase [Pedobacter sp. PWIIR3]
MKLNLKYSAIRMAAIAVLPLMLLSYTFKSPEVTVPKWKQMFDGKDLKGWEVKIRNHDLNDNFGNTFRVEDGKIEVRYDQYTSFDQQYGHLFYKKTYSHYLIGVEYRFVGDQAKGGEGWALRNSGIMIHGQLPAEMRKDQDFPNSIEVQLLGGNGDGKRSTANICTPGTQFVKNGKVIKTHCVDSNSDTFNGPQWVRAEVLVLGDSLVVHYINGVEVLRYQHPQKDPKGNEEEGELLKSGSISLQSESHPIDFRKVEIIDLEKYAKDPVKLAAVIQKLTSEKRVPKQ